MATTELAVLGPAELGDWDSRNEKEVTGFNDMRKQEDTSKLESISSSQQDDQIMERWRWHKHSQSLTIFQSSRTADGDLLPSM